MKITIQKTAKVVTHGNVDKAEYCWIVLHGYGQLVDYFIRKFDVLDVDQHFVIAPEGIHRFYLNGTSGKVGASWMTKEERLDDIQDNIHYLDKVCREYVSQHTFKKIIVVGFSQGASTAARWIQLGEIKPDVFVQWAGVFPPDLDLHASPNRFKEIDNYVVVGDQDPYFSEVETNKLVEAISVLDIRPKMIHFNGAHAIYPEPLLQLVKEFN